MATLRGGGTETKQRNTTVKENAPHFFQLPIDQQNNQQQQYKSGTNIQNNDNMIEAMANLQMAETTKQFRSLNSLY
jgi:hypothetical protein